MINSNSTRMPKICAHDSQLKVGSTNSHRYIANFFWWILYYSPLSVWCSIPPCCKDDLVGYAGHFPWHKIRWLEDTSRIRVTSPPPPPLLSLRQPMQPLEVLLVAVRGFSFTCPTLSLKQKCYFDEMTPSGAVSDDHPIKMMIFTFRNVIQIIVKMYHMMFYLRQYVIAVQ